MVIVLISKVARKNLMQIFLNFKFYIGSNIDLTTLAGEAILHWIWIPIYIPSVSKSKIF